jgi:hypothetical protein
MSVKEFEATSVGDSREWKFKDSRLSKLVELVDEYGREIYQFDHEDVIEYVFGEGTKVSVDSEHDPTDELSMEEIRFVNRFIDATPVDKVGSVDALYDSEDAFAETVDNQLGEDSDAQLIKDAIEMKAAKQ